MQGRILEIYAKLAVRPAINAVGNLTLLGGSVPTERKPQAMLEASRSFMMVEELRQAVNERLGRLTCNEAAYVSAGAAASLYLATAALAAQTGASAGPASGGEHEPGSGADKEK